MNIKREKVLSITIVAISIATILFYLYNYTSFNHEVRENNKYNLENNELFSYYIEDFYESGEYELSKDNKWPQADYVYNETLSNCENGSTLVWNEENKEVTITTHVSDKCYLYFDALPHDVNVITTFAGVSKGTTFGTEASLNCEGSTSKWNEKYNRLEVSSIDNKFTSCRLNFSNIQDKTYLNEYITDLATNNPDQGTGKLVHENAVLDNSYYAPLSESEYIVTSNNTTNSSGTVDNTLGVWTYNSTSNAWESQNKTNSTVGTMSFTVSAGEYKLCYTMSSEQNYDYGIIKIDDTEIFNTKGNNTTIFICNDLGSLTADNIISVSYSKDGSSYAGDDQIVFYLANINSYVEDIQTVDAGIRYEGKNPNNYVWFNNELWRIIGVFGSESHGQSGEQLVKIVRANSIGGLAWNKSNTNDWSISNLKTLLNGSYYDYETNGYDSTNCYGYSTTSTANCDYSDIGINGSYRPMIKNVTWYLRGYTSDEVTAEVMYNLERTTGTVYNTSRPTEDTGYIGLMYPSDYGYSVLADDCARITNLNSYTGTCASNSWMYGQGYEWTITPHWSSPNVVFSLHFDGKGYDLSANVGLGVRPVLYLDSSVYVINASSDNIGSKANPYIIGM